MKKLYAFLGLFLAVVVLGAASCNAPANNIEADTSGENNAAGIQEEGTEVDVNTDAAVSTGLAGAKTVTVTHTDSGFSTSTVNIKVGDTVKFVASSATPVWPASGPHPTHTILPEFDSKNSLANGASYSFKFTKAGSFPFHNHVNPSQFGKVVVE